MIYPPDWQMMFFEGPAFMRQADATRRLPPMGLLYIAAHLIKHTGHEVKLLDSQLENLDYDEIESRIRAERPDIVGITTYTHTLLDSLEIARRAKRVSPAIFVVMGGHHPSIYPEETAMLEGVDAAAVGEGEELMTELVEAIATGRSLHDVPGLYLRGKEKVYPTAPRQPIANLDAIPFPARSLLPKDSYKFATDADSCSTSMISSRGCRFKCIYCDVLYKEIRPRSPENVADEIGDCLDLGIKEIHFFDDNFNFSEERVIAICREIVIRGYNVRFSIRARPDKFSPDMTDWLRRAGCARISLGIETATDEMLRRIKKGVTTDMTRRAVKMAHDSGIEIAGYFIIGLPGQTEEGIRQTVDFAIALDLDFAQFNYMGLLPATEAYSEALSANVFDRDFYREFAKSPVPTTQIAYWPNPLSYKDIIGHMKRSYRRFYFRPSYIWGRLKTLRSFNQFLRYAVSGFFVITYSIFSWYNYRPPVINKD